jgi:hypothetical protein
MQAYLVYYHRSRTHLALGKDTPDARPPEPKSTGPILALPEVGGLHHRYERRAA